MSKKQILSIIGVWVALLQYIGFPESISSILYIFTGVIIIWFAYSFVSGHEKKSEDKPFVEYKKDNNS
jgi:energy-coupling factor transporter transmembrane protein EcfT